MRRRITLCAAAGIAIAAAGCDGPAPDDNEVAGRDPTFIVRDSAGVEIVENHAPEHPAGEFWTIDPEPEFVLGGADEMGEPAHDSAQLVWDVVGLARVEDGRVAVLSSRGTQLLLFEPSGKLSRIIGRKGEGPGEFTGPEWLQYLPPDTLVVWDYFMTSIDYFDTTGRLVRQRRVDHAKLLEVGIYGENLSFPITGESFIADMMGREVEPEPIWSDCAPYEAWTHRAGPGGQPVSGGVYSAAGRWLGVMPVPWSGGLARCQGSGGIHGLTSGCWVDRDFFVILRRDELGVEMVEGYRIRRGG